MLIQLLYFPGCPNVAAAHRALHEALSSFPDRPSVVEIDVTDPATPMHLRAWGSPTILVDGVDVAGDAPSGPCCRLYESAESHGAPSLALISAALERASRSSSA